jgi:hypothetical protein
MIPRPPQTIKDIYSVASVDSEPIHGGVMTRIKLVAPTRTTPEPDIYVDLYLMGAGSFDVAVGDQFDVSISPRLTEPVK